MVFQCTDLHLTAPASAPAKFQNVLPGTAILYSTVWRLEKCIQLLVQYCMYIAVGAPLQTQFRLRTNSLSSRRALQLELTSGVRVHRNTWKLTCSCRSHSHTVNVTLSSINLSRRVSRLRTMETCLSAFPAQLGIHSSTTVYSTVQYYTALNWTQLLD